MSPEQADPDSLDVDTGTDIYSLGVILYQLLTSTLPIESGLGTTAHLAELIATLKRIQEEEPQKPSTRVSSGTSISAEVAQNRRLDPMNLKRRLRGDLDWITMKALEKDRARRYLTANDLSADIERHLNHDPVLAGPPSRIYRLKKFVRKNAGMVASVLSLFVLLVAGGVTSTLFWVGAEEAKENEARQRKEAIEARNLAQEERKEAITARQREKEQREEAERQRDEVLRLSDIKILQQLVVDDDLWPAHPDKVGAMEDWRTRANELIENLDIHRASLTELRQQAVSRT